MTQELDQLHGLAIAADAEAIPATPEAPPVDENGQPLPPPPDFSTEAAGAVDMFSALVVGYCPKAESIWTPETKGRIAGALAPVMEKYGVTFGSLPPEVMLLIVAGPPLWQSSRLLAEQINADREKARQVQGKTPEGPPAGIAPPAPEEHPMQERHPQMGLYK